MEMLARVSWMVIVVMILGQRVVRSDFARDKQECQAQLISLSPCIGYISGEDKTPSSTCCLVLHQRYNQTKKCLCILVRDRNEPQLQLKINATLALSVPFICHVPAPNETQCLDLLSLDPKSPEAQIFQQFTNDTNTTPFDGHSSCSSTRGKRWPTYAMVGGVSIWLLIPDFIHRFVI